MENEDPRAAMHALLAGMKQKREAKEKRYVCDHEGCDFAAVRSGDFIRHKRTHTGERPYKCDYEGCDFAAVQSGDFTKHRRTHTGERPYKCDYEGCGKSFNESGALVVHKRTHTGERPYKCDYDGCDFAAVHSGHLATHKRTHTGERPYKCDYEGCDFVASQSGHLATHKRMHTGERPYECDYEGCDFVASQSSHLTTHKRTHTGEKPYKCDYEGCDYAAGHSGALTCHRRTHTGEKPFKCHHCGQRFAVSSNRTSHEHCHNPEAAVYTKKKEEWTASLLADSGVLFNREVHITYRGCGEKDTWARLDFEIVHTDNHIIIVSVDEGQHYRNGVLCEVARMSKVVCSIRAAGDMRRLVWIRFNPDQVKLDGKTVRRTKKERGEKLLETIKNSGAILESTPNEIAMVYLYYDAYTTTDGRLQAEVTQDPDYADVWKPLIHSVVV